MLKDVISDDQVTDVNRVEGSEIKTDVHVLLGIGMARAKNEIARKSQSIYSFAWHDGQKIRMIA